MECCVTYSESYGSLMQCKGAESICAMDLLSNEARYHSSNDAFVRLVEM